MKKLVVMALALALMLPGSVFAAEQIEGLPDLSVVDGILRVRTGDSSAVFRVQNNGMRFHRTGTIFFDNMEPGARFQFRTSTSSGGRENTPLILENDATITVPTGNVELANPSARLGIGTINPDQALDVRGTARSEIVEITGGSDLAESFDIASPEGMKVVPGMVVAIDANNPGRLRVSDKAYDRTVAGIVSGAGDLKTGMHMGQHGSVAHGEHPVALTGRVYCYVDASFGAIQPGDLLTTSPTPGHAMKVTDHAQATGAVLGKAMTPLAEGKGLVLVLVSLQ